MNGLYKEAPQHFAAANTYGGFKSYFDDIFGKDECERVYILKGGPGIGKSTFMKRVAGTAKEKGFDCECFLCSSDPDSFDGVIIKDIKTAVIDGTLPHAWEPKIPGAREVIIDLGRAWDTDALFAKKEDISSLCEKKSSHYSNCYRILSCKKVIDDCIHNLLMPHILYEKAYMSADRLASSLFKGMKKGKGKVKTRITNAFSCKGKVRLDFFEDMAEYCIFLKVPYEGCRLSSLMLDEILCCAKGFDTEILASYSPENPSLPDALYFPEAGVSISLYRDDLVAKCDRTGKRCKIINCSRFINAKEFAKVRPLKRFYLGLSENLEQKALDELYTAGQIHAELEKIYASCSHYKTVEKITKEYIGKIF